MWVVIVALLPNLDGNIVPNPHFGRISGTRCDSKAKVNFSLNFAVFGACFSRAWIIENGRLVQARRCF